MKSILYISFINEDNRSGYKTKIHDQVRCFYELGYNSFLLIVKNNCLGLYEVNNQGEILNKIQFERERKEAVKNIYDDFFLFKQLTSVVRRIVVEKKINIVYIRRIFPITFSLLKMLNYLKKMNVFIFYEYPTLPWKNEIANKPNKNLRDYLFYISDLLFFKTLEKKIDSITYMGNYTGKSDKYIKIHNCGDPKNYLLHKKNGNGDINLIGVAHITWWHGYDKIIKGLYKYYSKDPEVMVNFFIVGDFNKSLGLEELVEKYKLQDHVTFFGHQTGDKLEEIYKKSDIGVNCLRYADKEQLAKGITTLKTVEYTLRGLPQIGIANLATAKDESVLPEFIHITDSGKEICEIQEVVDFYEQLKEKNIDIRQFGIDAFSWHTTYKKVFDYYEKNHLDEIT